MSSVYDCYLQVFVVCCAHAEQVEAHLKVSIWAERKSMKLTVLTAAACLSPGDVLRFVDQKDLIKNDFVLVTGDVVANFDLQAALASHKQRRAADRHAIMSMVSMPASGCFLACHACWLAMNCENAMLPMHLRSACSKPLSCRQACGS